MRNRSRSRPGASAALLALLALSLCAAAVVAAQSHWTVSLQRAGPVYIGASVEEGARLLGRPLVGLAGGPPADAGGCFYVRPEGGPAGVEFMVHEGRIVRADVRGDRVATLSGARVGDPEDRVLSLYGDRIQVRPHKYVAGGRYLVYVPRDPRQKEFRLVFETDGERVTELRVGRLPEVEWVERCG